MLRMIPSPTNTIAGRMVGLASLDPPYAHHRTSAGRRLPRRRLPPRRGVATYLRTFGERSQLAEADKHAQQSGGRTQRAKKLVAMLSPVIESESALRG